MRSLICFILLVMIAAVHPGCADHASADSPAVRQSASDPVSGATLTTSIETAEISLAQRLWVVDHWTFPDAYRAELTQRDWSQSDWSVVQVTEEPMQLRDGQLKVIRRVQIEPFLPGDYMIPAVTLSITGDRDQSPTTISTEPIQVTVLGVLTDDDKGALNPIADAQVPADTEQNQPGLLWAGIAFGVALLAGGVYLLLHRSSEVTRSPSIYQELRTISDSTDQQHGFERLARVFERLDPRLRSTSEFREMINACDRARFGQEPTPPEWATPARIARHALQLLGHDTRTMGGDA